MSKFAKSGILLAFALACAGCSTGSLFESKRVDYKSAGKLPPLEVPPDLSKPKPEDRFSIPDSNSVTASEYDRTRRAPAKTGNSDILPTVEKVRLERAGSQRWLVVVGTPEQLWSEVKEFWLGQGYSLREELPAAGVMETDWKDTKEKIPDDMIRNFIGKVMPSMFSTYERDKFRTRLERGTEPGTTEIYISHRGVEEDFTSKERDQLAWHPRPPDPGMEAEMLRLLMVQLGVSEPKAKTLIAEKPASERAHVIDRPDGAGVLQVDEPFDRAWRRVGLALDRVGFTVEDRDRAKGLYYVRYVDPDIDQRQAEKGFFKRLFTSADKKEALTYRIEVKDEKNQSQIRVLSNDGVVDKTPAAKKILALLQDQLK